MISNDQLGRQWREGIVDGPHALDSVLVSLIAWGPDRTASLVGTGFIVAGLGRQAIAVSASHNFEHIARVQQPWSVSHPTALSEFIVSRTRTVSIDPRALRALYINGNLVDACTIDEINVVSEIDVAVFTIRVQEDTLGVSLSNRLAIDTSIPVGGQEIVAMSYVSMEVLRQEAGEDGFEAFTVKRRLALRRGVITEVYPRAIERIGHASKRLFQSTAG